MQEGLILSAEDVKQIIAEYFKVDPKDVIKSQYSYTVIEAKKPDDEHH